MDLKVTVRTIGLFGHSVKLDVTVPCKQAINLWRMEASDDQPTLYIDVILQYIEELDGLCEDENLVGPVLAPLVE